MSNLKDVCRVMLELKVVVGKLNQLYEDNPELNDIQPPSMSGVLASSIDEWHYNLIDCCKDWEVIAAKEKP
jgi:hypothetical protein